MNETSEDTMNAMYVGYPSTDFPGPPKVVLPLPENWEGLHLPDTEIAIRERDAEGFAANVVVRIHKHVGHTAEELFERLAGPTREAEVDRTEMFDHEPPGLHRLLPGRAGEYEIEQQHLLVIPELGDVPVRYSISIVGSSPAGDLERRSMVADLLRRSRVSA